MNDTFKNTSTTSLSRTATSTTNSSSLSREAGQNNGVGCDFEMRELASRICRDYLAGAWKDVTAHTIGFKHISGGLSNLLYHVWLPRKNTSSPQQCQKSPSTILEFTDTSSSLHPDEVLIRVYGHTHGERAIESLITESVIFTLLSERGLGPKLHGIFPGGRIEQYIDARPLKTRELEVYTTKIAQKMAVIHGMEVPLHKDPGWLWKTIERWLQTGEANLEKLRRHRPRDVNISDELLYADLRAEIKWMKRRLESEKCPVVFCHNDMQEGNILVPNSVQYNEQENGGAESLPEIVIIDFEYCSYNYRSFDIANHFVEWTYDYTLEEYPFYTETPKQYPSVEQRRHFLETYLMERRNGVGGDDSVAGFIGNGTTTECEMDKLLRESEIFGMASHILWCLWGLVNVNASKIPFGYWEYSSDRFHQYLRLKKLYPDEAPIPIKRKIDEID